MSKQGDLLRKSFKKVLLPALAERGFVGKSSRFQRKRDNQLNLLGIQYWTYGGSFILEFGNHPLGDLHSPWGVVPEAKLEYGHLSPGDRARLKVTDVNYMGDPEDWFSFVQLGEDQSKYDQLAYHIVSLLPQIEAWLECREAGPNISPYLD